MRADVDVFAPVAQTLLYSWTVSVRCAEPMVLRLYARGTDGVELLQ